MDFRWLVVIPASVVLGLLFDWLNVPAAWILAAIVASGSVALISRRDMPVNRHFYGLSRGFIGIMAAVPLTVSPVGQLLQYLPVGIIVGFLSVAFCMGGGLLLYKMQHGAITRDTGVLSLLPGGASMMPPLADELGADYRYVALTQYLRLLCVSVSLPLLVTFMPHPSGSQDASLQASTTWWVVLLIIVIATVGEPLGKKLHIPVASVMGPILLTVIVSFFLPDGITMQPPEIFRIIAFISIGWVCGGGLDLPTLKHFGRQLPATFGLIALVLAVCALLAVPVMAVFDITYFESYLATSPGALETVLALSSEGGAGPIVVSLQIIRLILVLTVAAYLPQILNFIFKRRGK